jgi:hypothetical protein
LPKTENKIRCKEKPSYKKRNFSKKGKKLRKDEISLRAPDITGKPSYTHAGNTNIHKKEKLNLKKRIIISKIERDKPHVIWYVHQPTSG